MADNEQVPMKAVLAVDTISAFVASTAVSPFVAIIDQSVISSAAGAQSLGSALKEGVVDLCFSPMKFFRQPAFLLMCGVYGGTYAAANMADSVGVRLKNRTDTPTVVAAAIARGLPKFFSSSGANMALSIYKDLYIARMYSKGPPAPLPITAFTMFMGRDLLTMAASFTLPGKVAKELEKETSWSPGTCDIVAQLSLPVAFQTVTAPLHLLGLNFITAPNATMGERMSFLQEKVVGTTAIRMLRIFPAFGVGGVTNKTLKAKGYSCIEKYYTKEYDVEVNIQSNEGTQRILLPKSK